MRVRDLLPVARVLFLAAGLAFTGWALLEGWEDAALHLPGRWTLLATTAALAFSIWCAPFTWTPLLGISGLPTQIGRAYFSSLLGKYIPGGVWQGVGQVGLLAEAGVPWSRAALAFPVHAIAQLAGAGTVAVVLGIIAPDLPGAVRLLALAGALAPLMLYRRWMRAVIHLLSRRAFPAWTGDVLPGQRAMLQSWAGCALLTVVTGVAFALLVREFAPGVPPVRAMAAFALAWAVGFAAVPFPAGVGVREALLVATVPAPAAAVVAASLVLRVMSITIEAAFMLGSLIVAPPRAKEGST